MERRPEAGKRRTQEAGRCEKRERESTDGEERVKRDRLMEREREEAHTDAGRIECG